MRDLEKYVAVCIEELNTIGIFPGKILDLKINTRAKKRLGLCKAERDENSNIVGYIISINKLLLDEQYPEKALKNTIIHELLHTCKGCLNHKNRWKELAEKVNAELGYDIKRVAGKDHEALPIEVAREKPKYIIECQNCGNVYTRIKRSKLVTHTERYRCGKCKGKLVLLN